MNFNGQDIEITTSERVGKLGSPKITIGIRPRAFTAESKASKENIQAVAELIEPMGAETLVHARTKGGNDIRVVVPREKRVKVGEALHLRPDPAQTHVFGEDGKAVRL